MASIGGETLKQRRDLSTGADYSQNSLRVHLGFGDAKIVETLVVEWPSGVVNSYKNVPINQYLDVVEGDDTPLPVSLTAFQAVADGDALALAWTTASELNNAGFEVQLAGTGDFEPAGFVSGAGTTNAPQSYTYRISALAPGDYRVRLKQIDFDGAFAYSAARSIRIDATTALRVEPAYPNPFNPSTTVRFAVREASAARAELFDATGRLVRVLHEGVVQGGGVQELEIEGASLPGGLYLVRIAGGGHVSTTPILLVK